MRKRDKIWLSGFVGGIVGSAVLYCGVFYVQHGSLPFTNESVAAGEWNQKTAVIEKLIDKNFIDDVDEETLADGMYDGLLESLDDVYSDYYSAEEYQKYKELSQGKYTGIGLVMQQDPDTMEITVKQCYPNMPADLAGVQANDCIYMVDGQLASEMTVTELSEMIKYGDKDEVTLTIKREGEEELLEITVVLDTIEIPVVYDRILEDSIGYIQIAEFTDGTSNQFETAYQGMLEEKIEGLIIDLRTNPGGLLNAVCDTLEQILPEGMIVYTEDKYGNRDEHTCKGKTPIEIPLVILIDENSASASEIFAGAAKDHEIATLVGNTTFGKGIVQKLYPLSDGSAIKLTVSKYYTPNGVNIHGTGIEPDVKVEWTGEQETLLTPSLYNELPLDEWLAQDVQMETGLEVLKTEIEEK